MSYVAGIDYSTHAVDVVLVDEDGLSPPVWCRTTMKGRPGSLAGDVRDIGDLQQRLYEAVERVAVALFRDAQYELALAILHQEGGERVGDDLLQVALLEVIRQMHVRVAFVGEEPASVLALQDDREMVAVLEEERREDAVPVEPLRGKPHLRADLLLEVAFDDVRRHCSPPIYDRDRTRFRGRAADALERTRSLRRRHLLGEHDWDDVLAVGIEEPRGYRSGPLWRVQGAVLAHIPAATLVQPWIPSEWRRRVGLPGNASKAEVRAWALDHDADLDWSQDACDALAIAHATLAALRVSGTRSKEA